jgi:hypothetical protein
MSDFDQLVLVAHNAGVIIIAWIVLKLLKIVLFLATAWIVPKIYKMSSTERLLITLAAVAHFGDFSEANVTIEDVKISLKKGSLFTKFLPSKGKLTEE